MFDLNDLNPPQQQCVTTIDGPLMLLAGAGTGKTRVITYRIANMLRHGIPAKSIVALTFTNKAAREMKERVTLLCGEKAKQLTVSTFHSFCLSLLRKYHDDVDLPAKFSIAGSGDQIDLVRRSLSEKNWSVKYAPELLHAGISYAKNQLWRPEEFAQHAPQILTKGCDPEVLAEVFILYERQLRLHQAIDFDDCIYKVVRLLQDHPDRLAAVRHQFRFMLVDEFQDTNFAQLKVIELLCSEHRNICVVGDDDQSIYSWRGAMSEVLTKFEEIFPERVLIKLEQNYRCSNVILAAANTVIQNNPMRKEKKLWSESTVQIPLILACEPDELKEARWIADRIMGLLGKGYKNQDIAILYRANALSRNLELALREHNLRYKIFGGQSVFERKEIKDLICYLRLISDSGHRLAFLRVINTPARGFGLKSLEKIEGYSTANKLSLFATLKLIKDDFPTKTISEADEFISAIERLAQKPINDRNDLSAFITEVIGTFKLEKDIRATSSSTEIADRKIEALRRVPEWLGNFAERYQKEHGTIDLHGLLDQLTLNESDVRDGHNENSQISLMSIHAAKGLEFPCVFVCGLSEGVFPHKNSFEIERGIDEERRLFYVALTRAKEYLHLSYPLARHIGGGESNVKPSRFLDEIPAELLQLNTAYQAQEKESEEARKARTKQRLSKLRAALNS